MEVSLSWVWRKTWLSNFSCTLSMLIWSFNGEVLLLHNLRQCLKRIKRLYSSSALQKLFLVDTVGWQSKYLLVKNGSLSIKMKCAILKCYPQVLHFWKAHLFTMNIPVTNQSMQAIVNCIEQIITDKDQCESISYGYRFEYVFNCNHQSLQNHWN